MVRIPKKKTMNRLKGQTERNLCPELYWLSGIVDAFFILLEIEAEEKWSRRDKSWGNIHTFVFEEGRSAAEISTAMRLMAAATREWGPELGFIACSLDVKKAFDMSHQKYLSLVMKKMGIHLIVARAIL